MVSRKSSLSRTRVRLRLIKQVTGPFSQRYMLMDSQVKYLVDRQKNCGKLRSSWRKIAIFRDRDSQPSTVKRFIAGQLWLALHAALENRGVRIRSRYLF